MRTAAAWALCLAWLVGCTGPDTLVVPPVADATPIADAVADATDLTAADTGAAQDGTGADADGAAPETDATAEVADGAAPETDATAEVADGAAPEKDATGADADDVAPEKDAESDAADVEVADVAPAPEVADDVAPDAEAEVAGEDAVLDAIELCPYGMQPQNVCLHAGICATGVKLVCQGVAPLCDYDALPGFEPIEASCDGLDNDCNGLTDDDLSAAATAASVGVCAKAKKTCAGAGGWQEPELTALPDWQATETACDGLDNDCDGLTDAGLWQADFPGSGADLKTSGVCAGAMLQCSGGAWQAPDYAAWQLGLPGAASPTYQPIETACDGLDNDCNGATDDFAQPAPMTSQPFGVCAGASQVCKGAQGWKDPNLLLIPGWSNQPEWACDGADNDCDGLTDEDAACPLWQSGGRGVGKVALSADGLRAAWLSLTGVHVVDLLTGVRLNDHFGHGYEVMAVAFAPDDLQIASVGRHDALRVWAAKSGGKTAMTLQQYGTTYGALAWSPDGTRLAVADQSGAVRIFEVWSGTEIAALPGHKAPVRALAWLLAGPQKGNRLISGDDTGVVMRWDTQQGTGKLLAESSGGVTGLCADPQSARVLVTGQDPQARVWNTDNGKLEVTLTGNAQAMAGGAWTGPEEVLTANDQGEVRRWLLPVGPGGQSVQAAQTWPGPALQGGEAVADLQVRKGVVLAGLTQSGLRRLHLPTGVWSQPELRHAGGVRDVAVQQGVLASAGEDMLVRLWSAASGAHLLDLAGHEASVQSVLLQVAPGAGPMTAAQALAGGALLATGSVDFSVRVWQVTKGPPGAQGVLALKSWGLGGPWPEDLAWGPAGALWVAGGGGVQAFAVNGANLGQKLAAYASGFGNTVQSVVPSPDGTRLLLGMTGEGPANGVHYRLLDATTLQVQWAAGNLEGERHVAAWRPDGTAVAVSGGAAHMALLDGQTGSKIEDLPGHLGSVLALAWAADGSRLLSAAADGTARVWQTLPGAAPKSLAVWSRHCPAPCKLVQVQALAWLDAAGKTALTAGSDGALMAWHAP